ncbi:MAG: class I SAM-dependent methyltransferase, partial [Turneriella sp.]|nr:class I SAM-dependent methyltransferase [Turneriella sp.]
MSFYRKLFAYGLKNAKRGTLTVRERYSGASYTLGGDLQGYKAELTISDPYFYRHTVLFGEVGFGEAYVAGMWESEDLARTLRWFAHNSESLPGFAGSGFEVWFINVLGFANRIRHFLRPNSIKLSRKNIAEHYDIGNDLYELMLGRTMAYS